jgi:hypothetical protein
MATVEFINNRIAGKVKEVEKLEKKLSRILAAKETNWEKNPYYYSDYDLRATERDLESAKAQLDNYKSQLVAEEEKAASRNVPAILEFLENWKIRVYNYYLQDISEYFEEKEELQKIYHSLVEVYGSWSYKNTPEGKKYEERRAEFYGKVRGYYELQKVERNGRVYEKEVKVEDGEWEHLAHYLNRGKNTEEVMAYIKKEIDKEADRKYDFIIERVNAICGVVVDASNLRVGAKDDLNGIIVGERGNARVQTIGAGGYNIQCFHFRTLINKA